jgi:LysR family transcriptional regulator, regulator for metE and metH
LVGRGLALAPAGERILETARGVVPELARLAHHLQNGSKAIARPLRVSTQCYTCYHWLPAILRQFERKYPAINVQIVAEATRNPVTALLENRLDLAIISETTRDQRIKTVTLFDDELVAITAKDHPLRKEKYLMAPHFASETLLSYTPLAATALFQQVLRPAGIRPKRVVEVPLTEAILELVKARFGIAVLARWAIRPYLIRNEFRAIPITNRGLHREWYSAIRNTTRVPEFLAAFIEALQTELQSVR